MQEARIQARQDGERYAAMITGAVEGFLEAIEKYRLVENAERALDVAGETTKEVVTGLQDEYHDPTYDGIKHEADAKIGQAKDVVQEKKEAWSQEIEDQADNVEHAVERGYTRVKESVDDAVDATRHAWDRTKGFTRRTVDEGKARAQFIGEGLDRAAHAPAAILRDTKQATGAWMKGFWSSMGLYVVTGIVALTAFVLLTMATVVGLNNVLGRPEGTFVAFAIYSIAAVAVWIGARSAMAAGRERAARHMEEAKQEARDVATPFERAFAGHWVTGEPAVVRPPKPQNYSTRAEPILAPEPVAGPGSGSSSTPTRMKDRPTPHTGMKSTVGNEHTIGNEQRKEM